MLQAVNLRRVASGGRVLLDDVSLSIQGGDRVAIVGPNGSGKSLLLRSLALLDPLDGGTVSWNGTPVREAAVPAFRSKVMYLHQRPALIEGSVEDNLRQPFSLRVHRGNRFNREGILAHLSALGRDGSFLSRQTGDLSGGEAQLTALLRALQLAPDILLLDEPTAALDAVATGMVEGVVTRWLDELPTSRASVWVTHDREQSRRMATSVLPISEGTLEGTLSRGEHG